MIEILEMLGGINEDIKGTEPSWVYTIDEEGFVDAHFPCDRYAIYSLEEFLEKFPYKIGDKALLNGIVKTIKQARWDSIDNEVIYKIETNIRGFSEEYCVHYYDLQPYKETMEDEEANFSECIENTVQECLFGKEVIMEEKLMPRIDLTGYSKNKYIIDLGDYDIKEENGKTYAVRKQLQYPKNYKECCDVLIPDCVEFNVILNGYNSVLLEEFGKLLICRDAYWKIVGEQMGLDKLWEPDWSSFSEGSYPTITKCNGKIIKTSIYTNDCFLAFPSEEMRDAFYENFKSLIEECKELL